MGTSDETKARYDQQRELLQERREKVFALIKDLDMTEAAAVLASAMNEHLLPVRLTAYFIHRSSFSGER